jgi:hypothetical protein
MRTLKAAAVVTLLLAAAACSKPVPTTASNTAISHYDTSPGAKALFADKIRGTLMDRMGLTGVATEVNASGEMLTVTSVGMSETLAREIMHAGLQDGAKNSGFTTVRFVDDHYRRYNPESSAYFQIIWQYATADGSNKTGMIDCHNYDVCKTTLNPGLGLK